MHALAPTVFCWRPQTPRLDMFLRVFSISAWNGRRIVGPVVILHEVSWEGRLARQKRMWWTWRVVVICVWKVVFIRPWEYDWFVWYLSILKKRGESVKMYCIHFQGDWLGDFSQKSFWKFWIVDEIYVGTKFMLNQFSGWRILRSNNKLCSENKSKFQMHNLLDLKKKLLKS